jgi:transposase InsO family protein
MGSPRTFGEQRCFDTPLAESGIVGMAVGIAMNGMRPVVEVQFDAFAYPAFQQIISHVAKMHNRTKVKKTRPYRPQTNGKIERFHRTLADGRAFRRFYATESARKNVLPAWLHHYNHHRPHTAIGGQPPISRLINLPGQYN